VNQKDEERGKMNEDQHITKEHQNIPQVGQRSRGDGQHKGFLMKGREEGREKEITNTPRRR